MAPASPIASDAVAAGLGALQTLSMRGFSSQRISVPPFRSQQCLGHPYGFNSSACYDYVVAHGAKIVLQE